MYTEGRITTSRLLQEIEFTNDTAVIPRVVKSFFFDIAVQFVLKGGRGVRQLGGGFPMIK
jgi:hypothetical protein